jgi:hypothetical protein
MKPNELMWLAAATIVVYRLAHWYVHRDVNGSGNGRSYVVPPLQT